MQVGASGPTFYQLKKTNKEYVNAVWLDKAKGVTFLRMIIAKQHLVKRNRLKELKRSR